MKGWDVSNLPSNTQIRWTDGQPVSSQQVMGRSAGNQSVCQTEAKQDAQKSDGQWGLLVGPPLPLSFRDSRSLNGLCFPLISDHSPMQATQARANRGLFLSQAALQV